MSHKSLRHLILAALFLAIGFALPYLTGQIKQIGNMLLPMHLPVFLCGFVCGPWYALLIGLILPIMRSLICFMPVLYPSAIAMAFELGAYGFIAGLAYRLSGKKSIGDVYLSLIIAMIGGRIVWGIAEVILLGIRGDAFTWQAFITGSIIRAVPGILCQIVLIPGILLTLDQTGLYRFNKDHDKQ